MNKPLIFRLLNRYASKWVVLCVDLVLVNVSLVLAEIIRFSDVYVFNISDLLIELIIVTMVALLCFLAVGSYKGIVRHTGFRDIFNVSIAVTLLSIIIFLGVGINHYFDFYPAFTIPKSIIFIHFFIIAFVLILSRFVFKSLFEYLNAQDGRVTNVLIYGAGHSGIMTYGALSKDAKKNYKVVGFIDDDSNKIGKKINRIHIFKRIEITQDFIYRNDVEEVIISIQGIPSDRLHKITDYFSLFKIRVKMLPNLTAWIDGTFQVHQIRELNIEDLLGRDSIVIDSSIIQNDVANKVVLITGAAGSIGGELSRQLSAYKHKHLVLIDQAESNLYDLQQELLQAGMINFTVLVADVRDYRRMELIFNKFRPQKVFHAAAYKHVPLMEYSPYEAIRNNVWGTKNIADLSLKYYVESFVMVSTDKAVNPSNVMGATKRVAEKYITCLSRNSKGTKFTITRFGNVLGSSGSVIPLFKKQIKKGGCVTVTHKEVTRFFMTIREACSLVLVAGTMGEGGEIYIFDMGKSIKIFDVAKKMIYLSGFRYPEDVDIRITGLRPGEKLYEELLASGENTIPTHHEKIMIAKTENLNVGKLLIMVDALCEHNQKNDDFNTVRLIKEIVPEYISNNSVYEKLDLEVV